MDRTSIRSTLFVVGACVLTSCVAYEPRPLDPEATVAAVDRKRSEPPKAADQDEGSRLTLARAAAWMRDLGPGVREAVAAYRTALARAEISSPLPNPRLEVGPQFGFGSDITTRRLGAFGSLGVTIPLGDRLQRVDDLDRVRAEVARVAGIARHRELYLELRRRWIAVIAAQITLEARTELVESADRSVDAARRRVEAGDATALDVALFEIELGRSRAEQVAAAAEASRAAFTLAELVGVQRDAMGALDTSLPDCSGRHDDVAALKQELTLQHPELARLRAAYEEAEAHLRLEIAKQYPDLILGPSIDKDTGESKTMLGLALGIELPLFDRNQKAIAEAERRREEARVRYEAAASRALAALERASAMITIAKTHHQRLETDVLPSAQRSVGLSRRALAAGSGDALKALEAERAFRRVQIEVSDAKLAIIRAWIELEIAVGRPLVDFPTGASKVTPPDGLKGPDQTDGAETDR